MLCLGPASSCDVCLDPFGADHKAPCSIECGHVFCLDCLDQLPSPTCPLCREPFNFRSAVKLHVDVDGCGAAQSSAYAEARGLQREIANVANEGTTEPRLRELISRCKTFLHSQSREMFEDLRVSHRMLAYLCEIKSKLRAQSQEVSRLDMERVHLYEEIEHLEAEKAAEIARLEAEKIDKENVILELERLNREERDRARDAELESRRKGMEMQARYIEQLEIANKLRADLDNLRNGVVRISTAGDFYQEQPKSAEAPLISVSTPPSQDERSISPEDLHPVPEQELLISPFPEFATSTLPMEFSTLPTIDDHSEENLAVPGCGAAGCPLSCNCQSVQLFTTTGLTSAPLDLPSPGVPSLLSLTAPRADDSPRSTSSYSPRTPSDRPAIEDLPPTCPPSPPLHSTTSHHVERLRDLLTDSSPRITASMPELVGSYREREGMQPSSSPRQSISSRSLESSTASLSTQPLSVPSVQPSSVVTTEVTTATSQPFQHRTGLSSASSAAYALERLTKERQKVERERRRAEKMDDSPADDSSRNPSRPVSGVSDIPVDSNYASSKSHSSYYSGVSADVTGSKGHHQSYHGMDSQRSSYSNPSTLAIRVEGRSSRPRLDSSHYSADANSSTKVENRARSSSRVQQDGTDADRSSCSNPSNLSAKMESRTSRSSSRVQQEVPSNSATSGDRSSSSNPSAVTSKPESRSSRSSSKMQHEVSQSSSKHYVPIQREGSYNYNSVSASNPSSYRDYDSTLYANTPPTASHLSRQSSTSMASTQTKPAGSSAIAKDSSNSYRQYSSSSGKNKLVSTSSLSANVGYAHA